MRLYLTNASAPYNPGTRRGGWEELSTGNGTSYLSATKEGSNTRTSHTRTSSGGTYQVILRTWVSDPVLQAGTIIGSTSAVVALDESNDDANYFTRMYVWVTVGDSDTVRGTLIDTVANTENVVGGYSLSTAVGLSGTLSSVSVQPGDRIVVEVGYQSTSTNLRNGGMRYGGTDATDLQIGDSHSSGSGPAAVRSPWIELPVDDLFVAPPKTTEDLVDDFDDNTIDTELWPNSYGTGVSEASGKATLTPPHGESAAFCGYGSASDYLITDSVIATKVSVPSAPSGASFCQGRIQFYVDPDNHAEFTVDSAWGQIQMFLRNDGVDVEAAGAPYDPMKHAWIRLREEDGALYWETSPDKVHWTAQHFSATPEAFANPGAVYLEAFNNGSSSATITFDEINVRPTPGEVLDIGPDRTNRFDVQVAEDGSTGNDFDTYTQAEIQAGLDLPPYFTAVRDGAKWWVQHDVRVDSATTSGSQYPRSELREKDYFTGANIAFDPFEGDHWIKATYKIVHLPPVKPEVVVQQLHNGDADRIAIRTQVISGTNMLVFRINGSATGLPRMQNPFELGSEFTVKIRVVDGAWEIYYEDMDTPFDSSSVSGRPQLEPTEGAQAWFFKAGCYAQTNETIETDPHERVTVWISDLSHWHTGWPAPEVIIPKGQFLPFFFF